MSSYVIKMEDQNGANYLEHQAVDWANTWTCDLVKAKWFKTHSQALSYGRKRAVIPRDNVTIEKVTKP